MKQMLWMIPWTLLALLLGGCESSDHRLAELAARNNAEQAQQNRATAEMAREIAQHQRRVIETVEKSRQDLVGVQKDLDTQHVTIDQERRGLADERHRESILAPVLTDLGLLLASALPLVLCWYLLHTLKHAPVDETAVTQLLVQDLVASRPVLLPAPPPHAPLVRHLTRAEPAPPSIPEQPPTSI